MKKKIINGILAAAILIAAPSAFVSCKDNDADLRTELLGKIADLRDQLDKIEKQVGPQGPAGQDGKNGKDGKDGKDGSVVTIGDNGNWFIDGVDTKVPAKGEKGDPGEQGKPGENGTIGSVITIGDNGNWFIDGKDTGVPAKGEKGDTGAPGQDGTIGSKVTIGENGNWFIDGEDTNVPATGPEGPAGKKGTTVALIKGVDGHYYWWLDGNPTGVQADGDAGITINGSTMTIENGTWWIDGKDSHVLAYTYDEMVKLIKDQIYNAERDGLTPELEAIIKKLLENLENSVVKSIKNMVTDVIAERTENSIFGQLAVPGFNPLVVAAYYGKAKANVFFPEDAIDIKGVQEVVMSGGEEILGSGGKIYVTLNPNEVETEGKMFSLESSAGKTPNFTLGTPTASTAEMTFGWTRAAGSNGLYEIPVELTSASATGINMKSDILLNDAKQVLNNIQAGEGKETIKSLAYLMADAFTDAIEPMPAYALKVTWGDPIFGTRTVRSGYEIAAISVEPLDYDFDYDLSGYATLTLDKVEMFIDKVIDKVNIELNLGLSHINDIVIDNIDLSGKTITVTIPEQPVYDASDNPNGEYVPEQQRTLTLEDGTLLDLATDLNAAFTTIEDLNNFIHEINNIDATINAQITSSKISLKAQIQDYMDALNNKINKYLVKGLNKLVQPTLLVKSDEGIRRARGSFSGTIKLLPTSYTAELLAPAYKKFIAVTEVNGAAATAADNPGQLGQILEGNVDEVEFTPQAGKTYKIAYSAVDYKGNIKTRYYIIKGK